MNGGCLLCPLYPLLVTKGFITCYKGIQRDTNFYRRSDGVTGGYKGLQWVTRGLQEISITIYCSKIRPLLEYASTVWGSLPKYLAEKLQSVPNRCLDIIGMPRTFLSTLESRCNVGTKCELERIGNDINHPNQIFLTKSNTSHGYNLRSKSGSVEIPKSGTQRHANSFIARATRLLL